MTLTLFEFYNRKSIFLTGASGFLGTVLLETLLRCFPGIVRIFILLREKKGVSPYARKNIIFKRQIFTKWCNDHPSLQDKVCVVAGDVCLPNLGLNYEDYCTIIQEVSIVFHCAASITFKNTFRDACLENAKGTDNVVEFCRNLKQLDVLVYTSTAYSNIKCSQFYIEEKVYSLPYRAQRFLKELENGNEESFDELISNFKKDWPNSYLFSKFLAEGILKDKAADLPVVIIRPSIIGAVMKGPAAGYIQRGSLLTSLLELGGRGIIRVFRIDVDAIVDYIPADIVVNTLVAAAWSIANERKPSPFVINCTSGDVLKLKSTNLIEKLFNVAINNPLPKTFRTPGFKIVTNKFLYILYSMYDHYLPAVFVDLFFRAKGSKMRLRKVYQFYDSLEKEICIFFGTTFEFETTNFKSLSQHLSPDEKEMIYTDLYGMPFENMIDNIPKTCDFYNWENDKYSRKKRRYVTLKRTMSITFIKRTTLFFLIWLLYLTVSKIICNL